MPNEKGEIENGLWDERLLTDAMAYGTVKHIIGHFANDKLLTLTNTRVEGRLTIKGLDYAINFNRDKWKHIILVVSTILGTSFALIAALFSVLNYKKTTADYSPKLDSLTKSIQRIEIKSKKPDTVYTIPLNNL